MNESVMTPVDIVQQFLSLQATRKEAVERLGLASVMPSAEKDTDRAIADLMNELSQFGDATKGNVSRDNQYQHLWTDALNRLDSMQDGEKKELFDEMEGRLKAVYDQVLRDTESIPESLTEVLQRQLKTIGQQAQ